MAKRIAVVGVGAVGGYFGGRLAARGHQLVFVARGATLQALAARGLVVHSPLGDLALAPDRFSVCARLDDVGPVDAVLLAVKAWQVAALAPALLPLLCDGGVVLPLQNGVEAPQQLVEVLGAERVLGGLCRIMAEQTGPAEIRHFGAVPEILLGPLGSGASQSARTLSAAQDLAAILEDAGVRCAVRKDITSALWEKLAFIAAFGGVGAATQSPIGVLRTLPETRALLTAAVGEVCAVAEALGVTLADELPARILAYMDALPAQGTASLQRDLKAGVPSELDALIGVVPRLGQKVGVPTPIFSTLYACLLPNAVRPVAS
jgi:2-dehydropantoate 2-reductase